MTEQTQTVKEFVRSYKTIYSCPTRSIFQLLLFLKILIHL